MVSFTDFKENTTVTFLVESSSDGPDPPEKFKVDAGAIAIK